MINIFIISVICRLVLFPSLVVSIIFLQIWSKDFKHKEKVFLLLNLLLLILIRIPFVFDNNELNFDESGIMGQAVGLKNGLYIWKEINPTTAGPINTYLYYWFSLLVNMPINYISAHLLALVLDSITLGVLYFSGKSLFNEKKVQLALLLTIILWNLGNSQGDIYHYASEKFSLIVISTLLLLTFKQFKTQRVSFFQLFFSGFMIALVPFAKPQGVLIAGMIGVFYLGYSIYLQPQQKLKLFASISLGGITFVSMMLLYLMLVNGWSVFLSQIKLMSDYGSVTIGLSTKIAYFNIVPEPFKDNTIALVFTLLLASFIYSYKKIKEEYGIYIYVLMLFTSLIAVYTVIKPGTFFVHYYHYLIPFLFYLILFTTISKTEVISLSFGAIVIFNYLKFDRSHSVFDSEVNLKKATTMKTTVLGSYINQISKPTDKIAIWGWALGYFSETQLAQAVSHHHVAFLIMSSHREFFKQEFLDEIKANKPTFFLDTSATGFTVKESHETIFPELAKYIETNYTLIKNEKGDRLFIRNDRVLSKN